MQIALQFAHTCKSKSKCKKKGDSITASLWVSKANVVTCNIKSRSWVLCLYDLIVVFFGCLDYGLLRDFKESLAMTYGDSKSRRVGILKPYYIVDLQV